MIETKHTEVRSTTSDPAEMIGKCIAQDVRREWIDKEIDKSTGDVVSIDRYEIIYTAGVIINHDLAAKIQFMITTGEIECVTVSNQHRKAYPREAYGLMPWIVALKVKDKTRKFLVYAPSYELAGWIVSDYVELNAKGDFMITSIKDFSGAVILKDTLSKAGQDEDTDIKEQIIKKFYQIETTIIGEYNDIEQFDHPYAFVVETTDVERAMMIIERYITEQYAKTEDYTGYKFRARIETAKILPCNYFIDREFSDTFLEREKKQN